MKKIIKGWDISFLTGFFLQGKQKCEWTGNKLSYRSQLYIYQNRHKVIIFFFFFVIFTFF